MKTEILKGDRKLITVNISFLKRLIQQAKILSKFDYEKNRKDENKI